MMRIGFGGEADAAMNLDADPRICQRGLRREQAERGNLKGRILAPVANGDRRHVELGRKHLGRNGHIGALMLDRLE